MPIEIIYNAISKVPNLGKWSFDVHQYFDFESTGNWNCAKGWPGGACAEGTEAQVKEYLNWDKFQAFYEKHDISIAVTEFGGHPSERCANWIRGFLGLLEKSKYVEGKGGVELWTIWRTCPHTSWYLDVGVDPETVGELDCIQFAKPQQFDDPNYHQLYEKTSASGVANGLKAVLKDFV